MPQESLVDNPSLPFSLRTIEEKKEGLTEKFG